MTQSWAWTFYVLLRTRQQERDALSPEVSDGMYGKLADVASRREVFDLQMELKKLRDRPKTQGVGKANVYCVWTEEMTMGNRRRQISSRGIWTPRKVPVVWVSRSNWGIHKHTQHATRIMVLQPDNLRTAAGKEFSQIQMWSHAPTLQAQGDFRGFQRW